MKFKVGDVCVVVYCGRNDFGLTGLEVTIKAIQLGGVTADGFGAPYNIGPVLGDGADFVCAEHHLILKKPPEHLEVVTWASCVWQPTGVTA